MPILTQVQRLVDLGLPELAGLSPDEFSAPAADLPDGPGTVLAVHPTLVPASRLAPLLRRVDKPGFVVGDMTDLDDFAPVPQVAVPDTPLYLLSDVDRGDDLRNQSPEEALPVLASRARTPLTINEGISWLLQEPDRLEPNHCFMCVASRKPTAKGYDARTPAIWISGGTGRDGKERRDAPKIGWCWWRNRHTWLGFASTTRSAAAQWTSFRPTMQPIRPVISTTLATLTISSPVTMP